MVLKGRFTRKWRVTALHPKLGRGVGPESTAEVKGPIHKQVGTGAVISPDGGRAWLAAGKLAAKPALTGTKHGQKVFTPVEKID